MDTLVFGPRRAELFPSPAGRWDAIVFLLGGGDEAARVTALLGADAPAVVSVETDDWNGDFSPRRAEKVFRRGEDFSGGADAFLAVLSGEIVPRAEAALGFTPSVRAIAGYSLAGLCALYAVYRTDLFARAASVSGSLWFDGFTDFVRSQPPPHAEKVVLTLGDREHKSGNPRMARVQSATEEIAALLRERGIETTFTLNPGGHFDHPETRLADAIRSLL